jgi:hypothetical protein
MYVGNRLVAAFGQYDALGAFLRSVENHRLIMAIIGGQSNDFAYFVRKTQHEPPSGNSPASGLSQPGHLDRAARRSPQDALRAIDSWQHQRLL